MPDESAADQPEAPETRNRSQDDAGEQAQTLADERLGRLPDPTEGESETERVPGGDMMAEDGGMQDLVDHMNQMVRGGRIDMSAYRGERNDDDEDAGLGPDGIEDDFPRGAD